MLKETEKIGAVVIGRNEGDRLIVCLKSLFKLLNTVVYVDSGSTDNSVSAAKELGADVVELDLSIPFTAARARNAGFSFLTEKFPCIQFVQFVDGDCELVDGWLETAEAFLQENPECAVVCGRRRERDPGASVYNLLCDIEWDTPIGEARASGGDALMRVDAFISVKGFCDSLIAGEEPELCFRLRDAGWKVFRIDTEMTLHDAAMTKLSQWWKRAQRSGHAYAEGYALHGHTKERFRFSDIKRIVFWGILVPLCILLGVFFFPAAILFVLVYPLQVIRLTRKYTKLLDSKKSAFWYAMSNVFGRFAEASGFIKYYLTRMRGHRSTLIEYK